MHIIGVDGGGTKTEAVFCDISGNVFSRVKAGPTNHQLVGLKGAAERLGGCIRSLLDKADADIDCVDYMVLGLAGIDSEKDRLMLEESLNEELTRIPHSITNDMLNVAYAGAGSLPCAVSICGTGHNTGIIDEKGCLRGIAALRYPLGNIGGGRMMSDIALHKAFRSYEGTGEYTKLREEIFKVCECGDMDQLRERVAESDYSYQYSFEIPSMVDELAQQGDAVCLRILEFLGREQADMTGRLLKESRFGEEPITVVLSGSIYQKSGCRRLIEAYTDGIRAFAPKAVPVLLTRAPAAGAAILAAEKATGTSIDVEAFIRNFDNTFEKDR